MNKTWVKIKDGRIEDRYNRRYVINEETGVHHSNPTDAHLIECGYRELVSVKDEDRLEPREGYYIDTVYVDDGTHAIETETYVEAEVEDDGEDEGGAE